MIDERIWTGLINGRFLYVVCGTATLRREKGLFTMSSPAIGECWPFAAASPADLDRHWTRFVDDDTAWLRANPGLKPRA